jgi:hypothetical protein
MAVAHGAVGGLFRGKRRHDDVALGSRQPRGVLRAVGKIEEGDDAADDRRRTFQQEQPLPAGKAEDISHLLHDEAAQGRADQAGNGNADKEQRADLRAQLSGKPVRQVQHDAGIEAGLRNAEQKAQRQELRRRDDEHEAHRNDAPHHQDARDPDPRAETLQQQVARDFAGGIADEEDTGAGTEHGIRQADIGAHLQFRQADIKSVEERNDRENERERNELPGGAMIRCRLFIPAK